MREPRGTDFRIAWACERVCGECILSVGRYFDES